MAIKRHAGVLEKRGDDRQADRQIRNEMPIHHVDVQPVSNLGDAGRLLGEPGVVGGEDAGRDLSRHNKRSLRFRVLSRPRACPTLSYPCATFAPMFDYPLSEVRGLASADLTSGVC